MILTKNFKSEEFGEIANGYQMKLIEILAGELQKVRNWLNSDCKEFAVNKTRDITMTVTSGVRTANDFMRLKSKGYNPSETSDHLCGFSQNSSPTLGAADIRLGNFNGDYKGVFKKLVAEVDKKFKFGQVILEYNPSTKYYWIHFGNDLELIFEKHVAAVIVRRKYLTSIDNGKSYQEYKG